MPFTAFQVYFTWFRVRLDPSRLPSPPPAWRRPQETQAFCSLPWRASYCSVIGEQGNSNSTGPGGKGRKTMDGSGVVGYCPFSCWLRKVRKPIEISEAEISAEKKGGVGIDCTGQRQGGYTEQGPNKAKKRAAFSFPLCCRDILLRYSSWKTHRKELPAAHFCSPGFDRLV